MATYITSNIDGKTYCWTNGHFKRHLASHGMSYDAYYETYIAGKKTFCRCGKPKRLCVKKGLLNHIYQDTCGAKACQGALLSEMKLSWTPEKHASVNNRRRLTNLEKYGVEVSSQIDTAKVKTRLSEQRIVTDGKTSKQLQQEKARQTKLSRYGDEFYNNTAEIRAAKAAHTVERRNEINELRRATNLSVYGVENQFQRPDVIANVGRGNARFKVMTLPSGKEIGYQGHEDLAIRTLLETYREDEIIISDPRSRATCGVPVIEYVAENRHRYKYYPDIFIPSQNRIIEVKSRWWYDAGGREGYSSRIINNHRKKKAATDAGYVFEFWVYDTNGKIEIV